MHEICAGLNSAIYRPQRPYKSHRSHRVIKWGVSATRFFIELNYLYCSNLKSYVMVVLFANNNRVPPSWHFFPYLGHLFRSAGHFDPSKRVQGYQ